MAPLSAEEKPVGSFTFINALHRDTPTLLKINGQLYKAGGYKSGEMTTGGRLYEGSYDFLFQNGELSASTQVTIGKTAIPNILLYLTRQQKEDGTWLEKLNLLNLPNQPSSKFVYSALSVSQKPLVNITVNGTTLPVPTLKMIPASTSGKVTVSAGTNAEEISYSPEDPAHYIIIIYDKPGDTLGLIIFPDDPSTQ